jgi:membrane-associated phospholipid phosphatase
MSLMKNTLELDAHLSAKMRVAEKPGLLRTISAFFAHSGDSWFCLTALFVLWLFGSGYWKWRAIVLVIAILITAVLVLVIKFTVRRQRPQGDWGDIYRSTDPHSFPSGHATRAFMLATMALGLGPAWFGITLIIWAPLVALGRVAMGVHYVSDVVVGMLLGIIMGILLPLLI